MNQQLKREFELLYLGFTQFRDVPPEQRETMSPELAKLPGASAVELRSWLAEKFGVTKAGYLASALDKRWKEVSKRQGRSYRLDKLRRAMSRLEMMVRGDPEEFDKCYEIEVKNLLDVYT